MTEEAKPKIPADKLIAVYIKMRDAKAELAKKDAAISEQMNMIESELLEICKATGQEGGRTPYGTFTRSVKTRYDTNDWQSMYSFIKEHNVLELLEQRVSQLNMKTFLKDNPGLLPPGLNSFSKYSITVRRPTK
jgi:ATP-dependent phosphoenolpyruvate carboxykinase